MILPDARTLPHGLAHWVQWRSSQPHVVRTGSLPNRHDTGSTMARSVDEVALIRDTVSHGAPVLIAQNSSCRRAWAGSNFFAAPEAQAAKESPRLHFSNAEVGLVSSAY